MVTNVESGVKLIIVFVTQSDKHRNYVDNRYRGVLNHFVNPRVAQIQYMFNTHLNIYRSVCATLFFYNHFWPCN